MKNTLSQGNGSSRGMQAKISFSFQILGAKLQ
jgi:hypothetical protein